MTDTPVPDPPTPDTPMPDAPMPDSRNAEVIAFNQEIIEQFRANQGRIVEGPLAGNPTLLLITTGARSGLARTTPLTFVADGDDCVVMASAGGSQTTPNWYYNLCANPDVVVEVGAERFDATAVVNDPEERDRLFRKFVAELPRFGAYQQGVVRTIPVVSLRRKH